MNPPSFKRAKRIVALHYGSPTPNTRKLLKLFNAEKGLNKSDSIVSEASRILALRFAMGKTDTDESIDETYRATHQQRTLNHTENFNSNLNNHICRICRGPIKNGGWQVAPLASICAGDCTLIANFYYTKRGSQKPACNSFKAKYGKAVHELKPEESFIAMLS